MPKTEAKNRREIKNNPDFRLRKRGSARTTFYKHTELSEQVEEILVSSLAIKGINYRELVKTN